MNNVIEKIKEFKTVIVALLITFLVGGTTGFFVGRAKIVVKEIHTIEYKQGNVIKVEVPTPYLVKETTTIRKDSLIPGKIVHDTLQIDTSAVVKDYMLERQYSLVMFNNDSIGKLKINSVVLYNKLMSLGIEYAPKTKVEIITKIIKPVIIPFVNAGYNTNNYIHIGGGVFYHDLGFDYRYNQSISTNNSYHEVSVNYKF